MAVERLQAALASATNEVTVAASNINFDFTLVKYEAPKEFQPLGELLSVRRRRNAETGSTHVVARRLGALFEGVCPAAPNLVKAYGSRVSEISKLSDDRSSDQYSRSMWSEYMGVDGTSIWAAATSAKAAIYVHLLTCMLARIWDADVAVSVWIELIAERRRDIATRLEAGESVHFSLASAAAQTDIPRAHIAEWDASARSWLRSADKVMRRQHFQLQHVLENISIPVNDDTVIYSSVIRAWCSAVEAMDKLLSGAPQAVNNGATLLALSSWHLYPDMCVFGHRTVEVQMNDALIKYGGVLTLGLSRKLIEPNGTGASWSLSLAHLRYYGRPVSQQGHLKEQMTRLTFPQFLIVVLGAILAHWKIPSSNTDSCIQLILILSESYIDTPTPLAGKLARDGLLVIGRAASEFLASAEQGRETAEKLIQLGRRCSSEILSPSERSNEVAQSCFGLLQLRRLLMFLRGPEERIRLLRRVASRHPRLGAENFNIIYQPRNGTEVQVSMPRFTDVMVNIVQATGEISEARFSTRPCACITVFPDLSVSLEHPERTLYLEPLQVTMEDVIWCFGSGLLHHSNHQMIFDDPLAENNYTREEISQDTTLRDFLCVLSSVSVVYKTLPDATISIKALRKPFLKTRLSRSILDKLPPTDALHHGAMSPVSLSRADALGIVAYFDSGHCDLDSSQLENAIAVCSSDSIYVTMQLICDPFESPEPWELRQILGNIGKPGVVILQCPIDPITADARSGIWRPASYPTFDGREEDHFSRTSLHLSFTEFHVPLYQSEDRGHYDSQVSLQEAVVSVYDSGTWVTDIDVVNALAQDSYYRNYASSRCSLHQSNVAPLGVDLLSVSSWDEVIDLPASGVFVVRAHHNWIARLALTSYLANQPSSGRLAICPPSLCWQCTVRDDGQRQVFIF